MNAEEQQFLKALVDRHVLDGELLNVRKNALETAARDKGFMRTVAGAFGLREEVLADVLSDVFKWGRMKIGVVAQRLVRRICAQCKQEYLPTKAELVPFGLAGLPEETTLFRGKGCSF
jgi:hypothetical protein